MMLQAYYEREAHDREWDVEKLRFLARLWGVEVPALRTRTLTTEQRHDLLRRLGGQVEVH